MTTHNLFKGIKRVLSTNTAYNSLENHGNFLYFVRETTNALEGDIWFQGIHYGHFGANDLTAIETALEGFLPGDTGYTNQTVKEYIDNLIGGKDASVTGASADGHVTIQIDEADGALTAATVTTNDIASASALTAEIAARKAVDGQNGDTYVADANAEYINNATSLSDADSKLDAAIKALADKTITENGSVENYVSISVTTSSTGTQIAIDDTALANKIAGMDLSEVHDAGKAIIAVSEEDGVVSATAGTIDAQYVDVADSGNKFTATDVEGVLAEIDTAYKAADEAIIGDATTSGDTLGKLEDRIEELASDAKEYHLVKITTGLSAELKERYELQDASGNTCGSTVDIPKDSHIVSITYITDSANTHYQNLEYEYIDVCGNTRTEYVDMSQLVLEQEFASGVGITNHVAHGVVDPQSEEFLTVGADGFKLSGVQDAIDAAKTAATDYTNTQIEALDYADTAVTGQYVSEVDETNGVISVQRANVSEATLNNYSKGSDATAVAATDTVNQAISKLENQIEKAQDAATTKVEKDANASHLTVTSTTASDGSVTYTIGEDDIASASDLTQEISDREAGDQALQTEVDAIETAVGLSTGGTYIADDGKYVSAATSVAEAVQMLNDAIESSESAWTDALAAEASARTAEDTALDGRLDTIEEAYVTGVTVNDKTATVTNHVADVDIEAGDIEVGAAITGETVNTEATDKVDEVLQAIVTALDTAKSDAYTGLSTTDNAIDLSGVVDNGQTIALKRETATVGTAQDGHIEIKESEAQGHEGELYGVMYWIDEETA